MLEPDPAKALGKINQIFSGYGWDDRFVTMVVAVVDPATNRLTLVNAGHMPPILRNAAGDVIEIGGEEAGLPVGVIDDFEFEAYERILEPGDFLTIYTDGFSEAMNAERELYSVERMTELISDKGVPTTELATRLLEDVREFAGDTPQSDDMCLVCIRRE